MLVALKAYTYSYLYELIARSENWTVIRTGVYSFVDKLKNNASSKSFHAGSLTRKFSTEVDALTSLPYMESSSRRLRLGWVPIATYFVSGADNGDSK